MMQNYHIPGYQPTQSTKRRWQRRRAAKKERREREIEWRRRIWKKRRERKRWKGVGNNKDTYSKSVKEKIPKFTLPAAMSGNEHPSQTKEPAYVTSKKRKSARSEDSKRRTKDIIKMRLVETTCTKSLNPKYHCVRYTHDNHLQETHYYSKTWREKERERERERERQSVKGKCHKQITLPLATSGDQLDSQTHEEDSTEIHCMVGKGGTNWANRK